MFVCVCEHVTGLSLLCLKMIAYTFRFCEVFNQGIVIKSCDKYFKDTI